MREIRRALVRSHDRWATFFTKLGHEIDADDIWGSRIFHVRGLDVFCKLETDLTPGIDLPSLDERGKARILGARLRSKVILLTGSPDNLSMRNLIFIPPQTAEEWNNYNNPISTFNGWFLGNFSDRQNKGVEFKRLGHEPVYLGQSSGNTVFDSFVASMNLFME